MPSRALPHIPSTSGTWTWCTCFLTDQQQHKDVPAQSSTEGTSSNISIQVMNVTQYFTIINFKNLVKNCKTHCLNTTKEKN